MAGQIREMINRLIEVRTGGNASLVAPLKIKLIMKGIDSDRYTDDTPDDPNLARKLQTIAKEMGVEL